MWRDTQEQAYTNLKEELSKPTILALYSPQAPTKISADASSYGLGAVLLQEDNSNWIPVVYASRSMTEPEQRYAQIEKEALATTWACEQFSSYILGMKFLIETDHKPLVPLLGMKDLDKLPPRMYRFRLRLARFQYTIMHVPGKYLYCNTADALSRAPSTTINNDARLLEETENLLEVCITHLPTSIERVDEYRKAHGHCQANDPICSLVKSYYQNSWPNENKITPGIKPYWKARGDLTVHKDTLLLYDRGRHSKRYTQVIKEFKGVVFVLNPR